MTCRLRTIDRHTQDRGMQQSSGFTADPVTAEPLASRQRSCDPQQLSRSFGEGVAGLQQGPVVSTGNGQLPFYQPPGNCTHLSTVHCLQDLKLYSLPSLSQLSTLPGVTAHRAACILSRRVQRPHQPCSVCPVPWASADICSPLQ